MSQTWRNSWRQHKHFLFFSLSFKILWPMSFIKKPTCGLITSDWSYGVLSLAHHTPQLYILLLAVHLLIYGFPFSACLLWGSTEDIRKNKTQPLPSGTLLLRAHLHVLPHICARVYTCTHIYIAKVFYLPNDSLVCLPVIWWSECEKKLIFSLRPRM